MLSQREAAKAWRIGRETLAQKVRAGEISAASNGLIDPSEMLRVFGEPRPRPLKATLAKASKGHRKPQDIPEGQSEAMENTNQGHVEVALLKAEVAKLTAILEARDQHLDDMRTAMRLLTDQRPRRGFWGRLKGE